MIGIFVWAFVCFLEPRPTCDNGVAIPSEYRLVNGKNILKMHYESHNRKTQTDAMQVCYNDGARIFEPRTLRESIFMLQAARGKSLINTF